MTSATAPHKHDQPSPSARLAPRSVAPCAFASTRSLSRAEMIAAPVRWPRPSRLAAALPASPKKMAAGLHALGLNTVGDLLEHLPSDSRQARTVAALRSGEQATVAVQVASISARPVRRRGMRPLVEASVFDATATMRATFFNQPWLVERYPPGTRLLLHGKADARGGLRVSHHAPIAQLAGDTREQPSAGDAVAHYPAAEGISSTQILTLVQSARAALYDIVEPLGARMRVGAQLPDKVSAIAAMHFPRDPQDARSGRRRLAFDELLLTQIALLRRRATRRSGASAPALSEEPTITARWLAHGLPFAPTRGQLAAIDVIRCDLRQPQPMQRLLMGEVGSGKTVVALYAMLRAVEHGHQAALMAPTETLAEQHFATIQALVGSGVGETLISTALLTGSTPARRRDDILGKLGNGQLSLLVGTHALIEPDVRFQSLAVAVIDEQHRFGVRQRAALGEADGSRSRAGSPGIPTPHCLHMTATPIPRTLAMARYGDLDSTALRELPHGRLPIQTRLVSSATARHSAYEQLRGQLQAGRQAFVVCPLVEEPDEQPPGGDRTPDSGQRAPSQLRAAGAELARLRDNELAGYQLALLHGAMRPREKQTAMASFASGHAQVLVATTVIEVGIDVPNATVMLIENAERFGISQLHQLRGRVGRGQHPGTCFLVTAPEFRGSSRLRALVDYDDGFRLAEIDLQLRSEGELIGTRQSGLAEFRVACLPADAPLLERARAAAEAIIAVDPQLAAPEHALLGAALAQRFGADASQSISA
jgi:ATP-dependent DNA helicase RecG